jgi:hypothetical protein
MKAGAGTVSPNTPALPSWVGGAAKARALEPASAGFAVVRYLVSAFGFLPFFSGNGVLHNERSQLGAFLRRLLLQRIERSALVVGLRCELIL